MASAEPLAAPARRTIESAFMTTSREMRRAYDARLSGLGLKASEAFLLAHVHTGGPLTQTQAAEQLGIGRAATGALIDTLERKGLVERSGHAGDRRVWLVSSTERAAPVVAELAAIDNALRAEMWIGITPAERRTLLQILGRLQANLTAVLNDQP